MCSEMLEAVGHEYYAEWFRCCDDLLAKDGLVVVQVPQGKKKFFKSLSSISEFLSFSNLLSFYSQIYKGRWEVRVQVLIVVIKFGLTV